MKRQFLVLFSCLTMFSLENVFAQSSTYCGIISDSSLPYGADAFIGYNLLGFTTNMVYAGNETYYSAGQRDTGTFVLMMHNGNGVTVWANMYNINVNSYMVSKLLRLSNEDLVLVFQANGPYAFGFVRFDKYGNFIAVKEIKPVGAWSTSNAAATDDGGFLVSGSGCAGYDPVIRIDSLNNIVWAKTFLGNAKNICDVYTSDGNFFQLFGLNSIVNMCLIGNTKIDKYGNSYISSSFDMGDPANITLAGSITASRIDSSRYYWIAGSQTELNVFYLGYCDSAHLFWSKKISLVDSVLYPGYNYIYGTMSPCVSGTSDGGVLVSQAFIDPTDSTSKNLFSKFDNIGNLLWSNTTPHAISVGAPISVINHTEDSTILFNSDDELSNAIYRMTESGGGLCSKSNYSISVSDIPMTVTTNIPTSSEFTWVSGSFSLLNETNIDVNINFTCEDTVASIIRSLATNNFDIKDNFEFYPNPVNDELCIKSNSLCSVCVYNVMGKAMIKNIELQIGINKIDVSDLRVGLYFVSVENGSNTVFKFLKL